MTFDIQYVEIDITGCPQSLSMFKIWERKLGSILRRKNIKMVGPFLIVSELQSNKSIFRNVVVSALLASAKNIRL